MVDLGMAAKVRPCVILSVPNADTRRNMSVIAPLTTQPRGGETEIPFPKPAWLHDESVVNLIGLGGVDNVRVGRWIGQLQPKVMAEIEDALARLFGL